MYPQGPPVGGVLSDDLIDRCHGAAMWRGEGRHQGGRRVSQQHAGAHRHGVRDGCQVITSLRERQTERERDRYTERERERQRERVRERERERERLRERQRERERERERERASTEVKGN